MTYDIIIKNGTVIDPSQGLRDRKDVAIAGGRIQAIEDSISDGNTHDVIEAEGLLVIPGLVDLHVHVWWGVAHLGIEPDPACVHRGVTTAIDAGSAGSNTFAGFRRYVMEPSHTRLLAFLHLAGMGQLDDEIGELQDMRWARIDRAVEAASLHADRIVGIKVRLSESIVGKNDIVAIRLASEAAAEIGKPVMIHIGQSVHTLDELLPHLRSGDIVTHSFTGKHNGILDDGGKVKDVVWDAARRGVLFDVGHGAGSFAFDVQEKAIEQNFWPGTISSDVHRYNVRGPVHDLLTTLSKYLYLGLDLDRTIEMGTSAPARAVGLDASIGTLRVGAEADISIVGLQEGPVTLTDASGETRDANRLLVPVETLRSGRRFSPHAPVPTRDR